MSRLITSKAVQGFTVVAKENSEALRKYDFSNLQQIGDTVSFADGEMAINEKAMKAYNNAGRKHEPWTSTPNAANEPVLPVNSRWIARLASNGTQYAVQVIAAPAPVQVQQGKGKKAA